MKIKMNDFKLYNTWVLDSTVPGAFSAAKFFYRPRAKI
jgi:hypothetical protein